MTSLEGWGSAIELRPQQPPNDATDTGSVPSPAPAKHHAPQHQAAQHQAAQHQAAQHQAAQHQAAQHQAAQHQVA